VEWLFLFSGGLTAAYMTKLFVAIFIEKGEGEDKKMKLTISSKLALAISAIPLIVLGVLPHVLSEKITETMLPLVEGHHFHHAVEYLAWVNLKGVLISLSIGAIVYFGFIRTVLIKKKDGKTTYICPWNDKISIECLVYVPFCKGAIFLLSVICRAADQMTDVLVLILRKTVFRDSREEKIVHKHRFAYAAGSLVDKIKAKKDNANAKKFSSVTETVSRTSSRITGNFSFALLMACIGICSILLMLIFVY
jgi:hydrogenase-4 component B